MNNQAVSSQSDSEVRAIDRWAAWLGCTVATSSLALVALADFGWFHGGRALGAVALAAVVATWLWRPRVRWLGRRAPHQSVLAVAILAIGAALIAPGSENLVGPRDPAVYVATGFAIARGGSTTIHDAALRLLAETVDADQIPAWLYENVINGALIRFPAQLFIRDLPAGTVEGGFLPVVPVWIALAADVSGLRAALHVSGVFGILSLAYFMLACHAAAAASSLRTGADVPSVEKDAPIPAPPWPLAGSILAVSFPQIWWAREPMAEPALGAFTWLAAWATVRWTDGGGRRWAVLAGLGAASALLTRADGILLWVALGVIALWFRAPGWWALGVCLIAGGITAGLHYAQVAPIYMATTYGPFTLERAAGGVGAVVALIGALAFARWLRHKHTPRVQDPKLGRAIMGARRAAVVALALVGLLSALSGVAPGTERGAPEGAPSPLAWLTGYVAWPIIVLALVGLAVYGWRGVPRGLAPLVLIGGIPALFYLPDPLVTGDHPWMVRRLVPAVIPLLALAAAAGAAQLWQLQRWTGRRPIAALGPACAAVLAGLGLGLSVAAGRDLLGPPHAAGAIEGIEALAADLPPDALVLFPAGPASIHLAMPLSMVFGIDAFALPPGLVTPAMVETLAHLETAGRTIYWAAEGTTPPALPAAIAAAPVRTVRIQYRSADHGPTPPPLGFTEITDRVTLYRLDLPRPADQ